MDGMLSQDEINALLQGMDLSDTADGSDTAAPASESSTADNNDNGYVTDTKPTIGDEEALTDVEKDAIGEVANISMGSSATTLYSLVNRKVNITTPVVTLATCLTGCLRKALCIYSDQIYPGTGRHQYFGAEGT